MQSTDTFVLYPGTQLQHYYSQGQTHFFRRADAVPPAAAPTTSPVVSLTTAGQTYQMPQASAPTVMPGQPGFRAAGRLRRTVRYY